MLDPDVCRVSFEYLFGRIISLFLWEERDVWVGTLCSAIPENDRTSLRVLGALMNTMKGSCMNLFIWGAPPNLAAPFHLRVLFYLKSSQELISSLDEIRQKLNYSAPRISLRVGVNEEKKCNYYRNYLTDCESARTESLSHHFNKFE